MGWPLPIQVLEDTANIDAVVSRKDLELGLIKGAIDLVLFDALRLLRQCHLKIRLGARFDVAQQELMLGIDGLRGDIQTQGHKAERHHLHIGGGCYLPRK